MRPPEKTMKIISQNGIWTRARKEVNGETYDINIKRIREKGEDGIYRQKTSVWITLNGEEVHDAQVELAIFKEVCEKLDIFLNPAEVEEEGLTEGPHKMVKITEHDGAWTMAKARAENRIFYVWAKHFEEPSKFGINNGRISKLWIREEGEIEPCVSFDRGWDVKPKTKAAKAVYNEILAMYN